MAEVSQKIKYVKLDDGVSFSLVRTNPKLTTNTKLMYNGKKMYMESYMSSELLNRVTYKNVSVKPKGKYNNDIANFLTGSGSQAYRVYQNFSDIVVSDSYDNQFETLYWCGAEYIDSSNYSEDIGFVAPLYLREKLPNYFLIFRLDTPSNYNFNVDSNNNTLDSTFDFKKDILDKAVLIKTFDLREGSVLGDYIHNYVEQEEFEFDKSMYVNFSNCEVTYYGINKNSGVFENIVESFENELLKNDNPILNDDKWFTEGFERNGLIFPYIINIEYLFDDENFKNNGKESYDFARYIGVYCNNIEFGEFSNLDELREFGNTEYNAIYYFEDNKYNLHRYTNNEECLKIDGKDSKYFDGNLISGFEKERITGYAEPVDIYEGFINRAQYGFEILKPFEPGDWVGIEYDGHVECYFADDKNISVGEKHDILLGDYSDFRFFVGENSTINDIAEELTNSINHNKKSKFEARCSGNVIAFYAKREGKEYNGSESGGAKVLLEASLLYNKKISLPISNYIKHISANERPIEHISDFDSVVPVISEYSNGDIDDFKIICEKSSFGDYYMDYFCGSCDVEINPKTDTYKNVFKIYSEEYVFFGVDRYLKTNNGDGRRICSNMVYIDANGKIDPEYRVIIIDDAPIDKKGNIGYDVSVSSTYQVEIMDKFKPNHGILSWFPVRDFDFDINYSSYGQYGAFVDECNLLSKNIIYKQVHHTRDTNADSDSLSTQEYTIIGIKELAKSPFFDDYNNSLYTEYDYYNEQVHPKLCLISKTAPYVSKWGYFDEQKDSCENPYRLNVNKVFGVSNLSANTYLRNCNEEEYTHGMPYYMTLNVPNYYKNYQYISSDDIYKNHYINNKNEQNINYIGIDNNTFESFNDCVQYWINIFKNTEEDMFSHFFSGKKYGKRFDKKYSRLIGGDKFHNPSTLFRGVKFEVVRQYNGVDKRSNEYNNYKFSFVYIPIMLDSLVFNNTVYFIKNDTFKFIVGIVFVNTMLGTYNHNIFNGDVDYFGKGFLYAACKDIIRPENIKKYVFNIKLYCECEDYNTEINISDVYNDILNDNYIVTNENTELYLWNYDNKIMFLTKTKNVEKNTDIIGEFLIGSDSDDDITNSVIEGIKNVKNVETYFTSVSKTEEQNEFKVLWDRYYKDYDTTIYGEYKFKYYGHISYAIDVPNIEFKNNVLVDICDVKWDYYENGFGYKLNVSDLHFKSESIQNILINMGVENSIKSIRFHSADGELDRTFINTYDSEDSDSDSYDYINDGDDKKYSAKIIVDIVSGNVKISKSNYEYLTNLESNYYDIKNLMVDIIIEDKFDTNFDSLGLKDYFSVFNQISMYEITQSINNNYNVEYHSTVEDNKYNVRVIEPDSIEIEDKYESIPLKITQNNKRVVGTVDIKLKMDVDKIGIKTINRYSGFYNPIFNDILYYDDYTYNKKVGRINNTIKFELPYSNTHIDYNYNDGYGEFGVIKNMYYHKTNLYRSDKILTSEKPIYPIINEYALAYRDYNIFSSSWDYGYFISQDDLDNISICSGIGSMKEGLCMFGSKYLNLPDYIFIDTFENGKKWDDSIIDNIRDNTDTEIMFKEINNTSVRYHLFIEKRLKRYLKELIFEVFSKYINKKYSFGNNGTIEDDVDEYVEKNLLKLYKLDKVYMYTKEDRMGINNRIIENDYLKHMNENNEIKIKNGFPVVSVGDNVTIKDNKFTMCKTNEFDRTITYNLKSGFKESFGIGVMLKRK